MSSIASTLAVCLRECGEGEWVERGDVVAVAQSYNSTTNPPVRVDTAGVEESEAAVLGSGGGVERLGRRELMAGGVDLGDDVTRMSARGSVIERGVGGGGGGGGVGVLGEYDRTLVGRRRVSGSATAAARGGGGGDGESGGGGVYGERYENVYEGGVRDTGNEPTVRDANRARGGSSAVPVSRWGGGAGPHGRGELLSDDVTVRSSFGGGEGVLVGSDAVVVANAVFGGGGIGDDVTQRM